MNKNFILFMLIGALLSGCSATGVKEKPNYATPPFIIDSHIHYVPTDAWEKSFLEIYTKHNAMGCILVKMKDLERGIAFNIHP